MISLAAIEVPSLILPANNPRPTKASIPKIAASKRLIDKPLWAIFSCFTHECIVLNLITNLTEIWISIKGR